MIKYVLYAVFCLSLISIALDWLAPVNPRLCNNTSGLALIVCVAIWFTHLPHRRTECKFSRDSKVLITLMTLGILLASVVAAFDGTEAGVPVRSTGIVYETPPFMFRDGTELRPATATAYYSTNAIISLARLVPGGLSLALRDMLILNKRKGKNKSSMR